MKFPTYSVATSALLGFLLPMAMAETASASGSSGIEGVIMVSPSRPGPIRKDRPNAAPARDVTFAVKRADVKVAAFTTDGEGRFRVALPPGRYIVFREDAGSRIGRWQFEAEVVAGEMIKVTWTADSGMR